MGFARTFSAQPESLTGRIVTVEVDIVNGMHKFNLVGLPDKAVEEARDRVGTALNNSNFPSPKHSNQKTTVSLAPAELKKEGAFFDLAIALGYLLAKKEIQFDPDTKLFLGELSLNGELKKIRGALPLAEVARENGFLELYVPKENAREAALVEGITIYPVENLRQVVEHLDGKLLTENERRKIIPQEKTEIVYTKNMSSAIDFADIKGQESAKRGLEIAAAGGHNVAMYGPPGTGKTMLAKAFASILPPLSREQILEVTGIHSISGILEDEVVTLPPFRSPHHTASYVSIIGGGAIPKPGEVTLAQNGVLFLDEFPEFERRVIESLRQPLEDRVVHISRARGSAIFPTKFILVAAMNPPPKDATVSEITKHKRKISGPIIDRIDIWFPVEHIEYEKLSDLRLTSKDTTEKIAERVRTARAIQSARFSGTGERDKLNSHMTVKDLDRMPLEKKVQKLLNQSASTLGLSPRSYHRVIKLARTIADLGGSAEITEGHILEALQYRPRNDG